MRRPKAARCCRGNPHGDRPEILDAEKWTLLDQCERWAPERLAAGLLSICGLAHLVNANEADGKTAPQKSRDAVHARPQPTAW